MWSSIHGGAGVLGGFVPLKSVRSLYATSPTVRSALSDLSSLTMSGAILARVLESSEKEPLLVSDWGSVWRGEGRCDCEGSCDGGLVSVAGGGPVGGRVPGCQSSCGRGYIGGGRQ